MGLDRWAMAGLGLAAIVGVSALAAAQQRTAPTGGAVRAPHATPKGWKFTLPRGDAARGREVFARLECYGCHEVNGEKFPAAKDRANLGPELSQMGPQHPLEYFAEAVVNPGAAIEKGRGYEAKDGSSKMPSSTDSLTVEELVHLAAYLKGLKPPAGGAPAAGGHKH
ncbi:MAG TPA: c-type cytochrome [Methylomirabilota bacterium]|nr:c-type cytochrome [Methylomirabilota bacterium]